MSRICREVQAQLPALVDASLSRWRRRLVSLHLRRCESCRAQLEHQQAVSAGLDGLAPPPAAVPPPEGLLDTLLEQAERPGVRGRAAVPARGAISGARPGLSLVFLLVAAAAGTTAGYAGWRVTRAVRGHLPTRRGPALGGPPAGIRRRTRSLLPRPGGRRGMRRRLPRTPR